jgi:hypothetical protein
MTFNRLTTTLVFLAVAMAACLMPAQNDTFWQLRAGEHVWTTGHLLYRDVFSHTAYGQYWPNHEWLTQVSFYGAYRLAGMPGVTLLCAAAVTLGWAMAWRLMRGSAFVRLLLVASVMPASATLWSLRPQAISLGFTGLVAWLIATRRRWWVPPVVAVWANFHGGALVAIVLAAGATAAALYRDRKNAAPLLAVVGLSAAAVCLTPLGIRWWPEMIESLVRIRSLGISEWQPASLLRPVDLPFWLVASGLLVLAWRSRRTMSAETAVLCGMALSILPLGVSAARNISPFLLVALPALTALLPDRVAAWQPGLAAAPPRRSHRAAALAAATVAAAIVGRAWAGPAPRLGWTPLPGEIIAAVESCPPNLYNRYDDGGYFIWFTPGQRVFLDGRQDPYPVRLILDHRSAEPRGTSEEVFRSFDIHCAALPVRSATAARLEQAEGWRESARSGGWVVLQRTGGGPLTRR